MSQAEPSNLGEPSRRRGRLLVALGLAVLLPAAAFLALISNWLPLDALLPSTIRMTGPVRASTAVFVWNGLFLALGAVALVIGLRRLRGAGDRS
jgi:hypothetical protein